MKTNTQKWLDYACRSRAFLAIVLGLGVGWAMSRSLGAGVGFAIGGGLTLALFPRTKSV